MKALIQGQNLTLEVRTRCSAVAFSDDTENGVPFGFGEIEKIKVTLVSNSVRDKVLYNLNVQDFLKMFKALYLKKAYTDSPVIIPFGNGDLLLTDSDYLLVEITLKSGVYGNSDSVEYDRVIVGELASVPLSVKRYDSVNDFDSAYYSVMILDAVSGLQYFDRGQKVNIPANYFIPLKDANNLNVVTLRHNTMYSFDTPMSFLLVDH